jgi:hypothetical protein
MAELDKKRENVKTPRALGCFVFLKSPRPGMNGGEAKYGIMLMWPKNADLSRLTKAIEEAAVSKWGPNAVNALKTGRLKNPLRDGDKKFEEGGDETFKGQVFMNASSTSRPGIVDTNGVPVDPSEVYSGCFFHAAVRFFPYDKNGNKGVGVGLQNLLLVSKGPRIDGRKSADKDFENFTPDVRDGDNSDIGDMI